MQESHVQFHKRARNQFLFFILIFFSIIPTAIPTVGAATAQSGQLSISASVKPSCEINSDNTTRLSLTADDLSKKGDVQAFKFYVTCNTALNIQLQAKYGYLRLERTVLRTDDDEITKIPYQISISSETFGTSGPFSGDTLISGVKFGWANSTQDQIITVNISWDAQPDLPDGDYIEAFNLLVSTE